MSGVASVWDFIKQVLGMAGLAESIFELVYILAEKENLRQFERFFFAFLASTELVGELVVFVTILGLTRTILYKRHSMERKEKVAEFVQVLVRDPIHNLADSAASVFADSKPYYKALTTSLLVSGYIPVLAWWFFVPVWAGFDNDDDLSLKLWICCSAWIMLLGNLARKAILIPRSDIQTISDIPSAVRRILGPDVAEYVVFYSFSKIVALCLLYLREDRLADDNVGEALRAFQLAELSSSGRVLWQIWSDGGYAKKLGDALITAPVERTMAEASAEAVAQVLDQIENLDNSSSSSRHTAEESMTGHAEV